ncbi:hypothetical protein F4824DRAFT_453179 [Ustulina deusta]|nr:hypothetical protein F4824DRAFT_453179 [Ustulina deusta]
MRCSRRGALAGYLFASTCLGSVGSACKPRWRERPTEVVSQSVSQSDEAWVSLSCFFPNRNQLPGFPSDRKTTKQANKPPTHPIPSTYPDPNPPIQTPGASKPTKGAHLLRAQREKKQTNNKPPHPTNQPTNQPICITHPAPSAVSPSPARARPAARAALPVPTKP